MPSNPTPIRLLLQEASVEFKADLKKLYATSQFPIATARGKVDVAGKAKIVNYDPDPINQLFWAQNTALGMVIPIDRELATVNANAITVANAATFDTDNGVVYNSGTKAGQVLLRVTSNVQAGQYMVNSTSGVYTFNGTDNGIQMAVSYTYSNTTRGKTITMVNQLMGYAPTCRVDFWGTFRGKLLGIRLNAVTFGSWTYPSKLEDFWVLNSGTSLQ